MFKVGDKLMWISEPEHAEELGTMTVIGYLFEARLKVWSENMGCETTVHISDVKKLTKLEQALK